jgi:hypothetical protein
MEKLFDSLIEHGPRNMRANYISILRAFHSIDALHCRAFKLGVFLVFGYSSHSIG